MKRALNEGQGLKLNFILLLQFLFSHHFAT